MKGKYTGKMFKVVQRGAHNYPLGTVLYLGGLNHMGDYTHIYGCGITSTDVIENYCNEVIEKKVGPDLPTDEQLANWLLLNGDLTLDTFAPKHPDLFSTEYTVWDVKGMLKYSRYGEGDNVAALCKAGRFKVFFDQGPNGDSGYITDVEYTPPGGGTPISVHIKKEAVDKFCRRVSKELD